MSLSQLGYIPLPPHSRPGGFDHAAAHRATGRLYVAHTINDAGGGHDPDPGSWAAGLDLDSQCGRLFCACDGKELVVLDSHTCAITDLLALNGAPDVVFFNAGLNCLHVAIGDPGVIDVFDTAVMRRLETVSRERGAHTIGFDPARNKVYAFLPQSCGAAVYADNS